MAQKIAILGATGSIGTQALDLIKAHSDKFEASILTAHGSCDALFKLAREFRPVACGLVIEPDEIPEDLSSIDWYFGQDCSERALRAHAPDAVLAAIVGIAGLPTVMTALDVSRRVLLANKEALVTGGELVLRKARERGAALLPVDSEHSAIFQCLEGRSVNEPARLILTASGGPFRTWPAEKIADATVADALGHPTWNMGAKITVDCATMMNKGLEVIEAHHLFSMPLDRIDVIVHPESVIHSMVEYADGSVIAQLGTPDMRAAIGYAMGYPERVPFDGRKLDFAKIGCATFEAPDFYKFPCLKYAYDAQRAGGVMPVALNGANEAAVGAFLNGRIGFGRIPELVDAVLQKMEPGTIGTVEDVYAADASARRLAEAII